MKNRIRIYAGQYYDSETGLHYNYHRYYDPTLGRYLRADPIGLEGGINLYSYVQNRPLNFTDPEGLFSFGGGFYFGGGAELSLNSQTCCENDKLYEVGFVTACGGVGLSAMGKLPATGSFAGISSKGNSCPKTRYYFRHDTTFFARGVGVDAGGDGVNADINATAAGLGTSWKFCSDTVVSKKKLSDCCE